MSTRVDAADWRLRPDYRPDLDGLRALAIIIVVVFHAFPSVMPGGFVGVDVFFVISGFLISRIILGGLQRGSFGFGHFYANRIRRLFPALLLVLAACLVFGWFFLLPDEYEHLGKHTVGAAGYVENFLLRREAGYFDIRSSLKPLMHIWSLGIEEQFYLTYPFFLWLVWKLRLNPLPLVVLIALVSFGLNLSKVQHDASAAFFLPQTRAWELMVGCAIACWPVSKQRAASGIGAPPDSLRESAFRNSISVAGLLLIVVAAFWIHDSDPFPGWRALLPVAGTALLIASGPGAWLNRRLLAASGMVLIGLISYPWYLWHWPMLTFARVLHAAEPPVAVRCVLVELSFAFAWVTWRFVESPVRFGSRTWLKPVGLVLGSAVIAALGYAAHRDGFMSRFPEYREDLGRLREVQWSTAECRKLAGIHAVDYCRTNADRAPDILLVGDSHAAVLYDGLAPAYKQHSIALMNLGQAGCVPLFDTDSYSAGVPDKNCKSAVNDLLTFTVNAKSAHAIILSMRGPRYMSGHGFGAVEQGAAPKLISGDGMPNAKDQAAVFAGSLRNTIARLSASRKAITLFLDWPELGFDPRSCLPRPVQLFSAPKSFCAVPTDQVETRNRPYRDLVSELQRDFPALMVFDPAPYLCDTSGCYGMRAGHLLYSDDNHLSIAGATYVGRQFLRQQQLQ